jgi:hypothetical protein
MCLIFHVLKYLPSSWRPIRMMLAYLIQCPHVISSIDGFLKRWPSSVICGTPKVDDIDTVSIPDHKVFRFDVIVDKDIDIY